MTTPLNLRPGTLVEVVRRVKAGQQKFSMGLAEFLDEFYMDTNDRHRYGRISGRPCLLDDAVMDAYIGAVGEHLAYRWNLAPPPAWTDDPARFLHHPWFPPGVEAEKPFLLVESPAAFRRRMLFVEAEPLRRARMPRDDRWWACEYLRSGLLPDNEDDGESMAAGI